VETVGAKKIAALLFARFNDPARGPTRIHTSFSLRSFALSFCHLWAPLPHQAVPK